MPSKSFRVFLTDEFFHSKIRTMMKNQKYVPVSPSIIRRVLGGSALRRVVCYHVSSVADAASLLRLQGSKKSVCVSHLIEPHLLKFWSAGSALPIIAKLRGTLLLSSDSDVMSVPDEDGMRWMNLEFIWNLTTAKERETWNRLGFGAFVTELRKIHATYMNDSETQTGTETYKRIKGFFDDIEALLHKYRELFELMLFRVSHKDFTGATRPGEHFMKWAESLVNEIEVVAFGVQTDADVETLKSAATGIPIIKVKFDDTSALETFGGGK